MQVFRLVNGGFVDKMIAFDSLPHRLISGIRSKNCEGLPRYWATWLKEKGSIRDVVRTETKKDAQLNYHFTYTKIGDEPCMFVLDYKDINNDKEKWQEIVNYVRRTVDKTVRLMDKLEDMAIPMAPDSYVSITLEPEDIPVIPVPAEFIEHHDPVEIIKPGEELMEPVRRKPGRPKKVTAGV